MAARIIIKVPKGVTKIRVTENLRRANRINDVPAGAPIRKQNRELVEANMMLQDTKNMLESMQREANAALDRGDESTAKEYLRAAFTCHRNVTQLNAVINEMQQVLQTDRMHKIMADIRKARNNIANKLAKRLPEVQKLIRKTDEANVKLGAVVDAQDTLAEASDSPDKDVDAFEDFYANFLAARTAVSAPVPPVLSPGLEMAERQAHLTLDGTA